MLCTHYSYLFIYLISIQRFPVGVSTRVKRTHKLIVVNVTIAIHVKDVCHCVHLQRVGGKFCSREVPRHSYLKVCATMLKGKFSE